MPLLLPPSHCAASLPHLFRGCFALLLLLFGTAAQAHPMPNSAVLLDLHPGGVAAEIQLPLEQLQLAFGHDVRNNVIPPLFISQAGGNWWAGFRGMVALGMHHIAEGTDHLLFLLVLLLPAPLLRRASPGQPPLLLLPAPMRPASGGRWGRF